LNKIVSEYYIEDKNDERKKHDHDDVPSSARVWETVVLDCDINNVWKVLRPCDFRFSKQVEKCEMNHHHESSVGSHRILHYKDGTKQTIEIRELSDLHYFVTWEINDSDPNVSYTSAIHRVRCYEVTNPNWGARAQTFVEWSTEFSNDAKLIVIEDSRHKKKEYFNELATYLKC